MIIWKIKSNTKDLTCYKPYDVFDAMIYEFSKTAEEAIEAESWCEIACIGEVYDGEDITITVEEGRM